MTKTKRKNKLEIPKIDARHMSPEALRGLRERAMAMLGTGVAYRRVAAALGVSNSVVYKWLTRMRELGVEQASQGKRRGPREESCERVRRLTRSQQEVIRKTIIDTRPNQLDFNFSLWTQRAVHDLIVKKYQIDLSVMTISRYMKNWGFSLQSSVKKVLHQDSATVKTRLKEEYPSVTRKAKAEKGIIYRVVESGVQPGTGWIRSFATGDKTPQILQNQNSGYDALVMISAVTNQGGVKFRIQKGAVNAEHYLSFLKDLVKDNEGKKVFVIADNAQFPQDKFVKAWAEENNDKIELFLPMDSSNSIRTSI